MPKSRAAFPEVDSAEDGVPNDEQDEAPHTPPFEDEENELEVATEEVDEPELDEEFPDEWAAETNGGVDHGDEEVHTPVDDEEFEAEAEDDLFDEAATTVEPEKEEELPPEEDFVLGGHFDLLREEDYGEEPLSPFDDEPPEYEQPLDDDPDEEEEAATNEIKREEDLPLDEVPEHLRDAVESSRKLKQILEAGEDEHPAKRRRIEAEEEADDEAMKRESHPAKTQLLRELRLEDDSVCRYVVESSELDEVELFRKSRFVVRREDKKSSAEQVHDQFIRIRERDYPPGKEIDPVAAFRYRWKELKEEEVRMLRNLSHKDLRYVLAEYSDDDKDLKQILEKAKTAEPIIPAAMDRPGSLTLGRFNRLELIDPSAVALVVGDANLTFSLLLNQHRKALGHSGKTVATTFEQVETLRERYKEIDETIKTLKDAGSEVLHGVDCTRIGADTRFQGKEEQFGAVYYNFPHAGAVKGFFDGHPFVRWRHENLMHLFFRALRSFVKPGGSVKVSSNQRAQGVRFSDVIIAAATNEFIHVETVPFNEWMLRNYNRSYGDKRDVTRRLKDGEIYAAQRGNNDMVYCFCYAPSGGTLAKPKVRYPPTKRDLMQANEGSLKGISGDRKRHKVEELTELFLSYVQGIHVG
jgi:hypothetical protein